MRCERIWIDHEMTSRKMGNFFQIQMKAIEGRKIS